MTIKYFTNLMTSRTYHVNSKVCFSVLLILSQQMKLIPLMTNSLDGLIKTVDRGTNGQNLNGLIKLNKWRCLMDLTWMAHETKCQVIITPNDFYSVLNPYAPLFMNLFNPPQCHHTITPTKHCCDLNFPF